MGNCNSVVGVQLYYGLKKNMVWKTMSAIANHAFFQKVSESRQHIKADGHQTDHIYLL